MAKKLNESSQEQDFKKYRWFITSSGKTVIGGKSAIQNDDLLKSLKKSEKNDLIVMHTSSPGSPFSVILSPNSEVSKSDIEETAVFTACFSKAWRAKKRKEEIHVFSLSKLSKPKSAKPGTWTVKDKIKKLSVPLELGLTKQKDILRAVPLKTLKGKKPILTITPGKVDKTSLLPKLALELNDKFSQESILSALPSGGIKINRK